MRAFRALLLLSLFAGCSVAPPPKPCCDALTTTPVQGALSARADQFQSIIDTKLRPHWPNGSLINLQFADTTMSGPVQAYNDPQDSAIWTGVYAAAQAYRYASTRSPEALAAVRDAVNALHTLATVPGYPGGLARVASKDIAVVGGSCTAAQQYCYQTSDGIYWLGNTSRDQYTGWFFGMAIAYRFVDDKEIRMTIANDVGTLITAVHNWNYVLHDQNGQPNSRTAGQVHHQMRLVWHLIAATILNEEPYLQWYKEQTSFLDLAKADLEDAVDGTNRYYDYYSYNLGFLNAFNMVVLESDPKLHAFYLDMLNDELYRYVDGTQNVFFDYMTMAARGTTSPATLEQDRAALAAFPGPPSVFYCAQPTPTPIDRTSIRLYWVNRLISRNKIEAYPQSKTTYPLDQRCRVNFLWQASPYKESCCCVCAPSTSTSCPASTYSSTYCSQEQTQAGYLVYPGADYLVAYWMGKYHHFLE